MIELVLSEVLAEEMIKKKGNGSLHLDISLVL